jgi:hypothetical protein
VDLCALWYEFKECRQHQGYSQYGEKPNWSNDLVIKVFLIRSLKSSFQRHVSLWSSNRHRSRHIMGDRGHCSLGLMSCYEASVDIMQLQQIVIHPSIHFSLFTSEEKGAKSRIAFEKTESTQTFDSDFENLDDVDLIAVSRMQMSLIN